MTKKEIKGMLKQIKQNVNVLGLNFSQENLMRIIDEIDFNSDSKYLNSEETKICWKFVDFCNLNKTLSIDDFLKTYKKGL